MERRIAAASQTQAGNGLLRRNIDLFLARGVYLFSGVVKLAGWADTLGRGGGPEV